MATGAVLALTDVGTPHALPTALCHLVDSLVGDAEAEIVDQGNNQIGVDPQLLPLAGNGGNGGRTHAFSPISPARDAGAVHMLPVPLYDQRGSGFPRLVGPEIDIGAFELAIGEDQIFRDRFEQP